MIYSIAAVSTTSICLGRCHKEAVKIYFKRLSLIPEKSCGITTLLCTVCNSQCITCSTRLYLFINPPGWESTYLYIKGIITCMSAWLETVCSCIILQVDSLSWGFSWILVCVFCSFCQSDSVMIIPVHWQRMSVYLLCPQPTWQMLQMDGWDVGPHCVLFVYFIGVLLLGHPN